MGFLARHTTLVMVLLALLFVTGLAYINNRPQGISVFAPGEATSSIAGPSEDSKSTPTTAPEQQKAAPKATLPAPAKQLNKTFAHEGFVPEEETIEKRLESLDERVSSIDEKLIEQGYLPDESQKLDIVKKTASMDKGDEIAERIKQINDRLGQ